MKAGGGTTARFPLAADHRETPDDLHTGEPSESSCQMAAGAGFYLGQPPPSELPDAAPQTPRKPTARAERCDEFNQDSMKAHAASLSISRAPPRGKKPDGS